MYTLGIDIGSTTSKCAVLKDGKELVARSLQTGGLGTGGPEEALAQLWQTSGLTRADMACAFVTGYGRKNYEGADGEISELTAHALGGRIVFLALTVGIFSAGLVGICCGDLTIAAFAQSVWDGFTGMNEVFFLTLLCGGMSELIAKNGGIAWIIQKLRKVMKGNKSAQVGIAAMVSLCDCATANNTVAIIVAGDMARDVSQEYRVDPRRTASLLDIFSCVFQGIIPYGAQLLSAAALANATVTSDALHTSPAAIVGGMWYCWILAAVGLLSIFVPFADGVCRKDPWNWEYGCAQSAVAAKKALLEKEAEDVSAQ